MSPDTLVPDYCEPITAWRGWGNPHLKGRLVSSYRTIWEPHQRLEAKHRKSPISLETVACPGCPCDSWDALHYGCGIYGIKTRELFEAVIRNGMEPSVIGQVYLWGRVIEHERGYRAQYAYPKCLVWTEERGLGQQLADVYGIPYVEDLSWTSVVQSAESSQNRYVSLSLSQYQQHRLGQRQLLNQWTQFHYPPNSFLLRSDK